MNDISEGDKALARILGAVDALWEPCRADRSRCGSHQQRINVRAHAWQAREEYRKTGVQYLPEDRSWRGRQKTADLLAGLSSSGYVLVAAGSGRVARVRLTQAGSRYIRRRCGLPTLESSAGMLAKLMRLWHSTAKKNRPWKRRGCVSELALIHPSPAKFYGKLRTGQLGFMLQNAAPWLHLEFIASHETTLGAAFLEPTELGLEYFDGIDQATIEPNWRKAFDIENRAMLDDGDVSLEQMVEFGAIANETFRRERAAMFVALPESAPRVGRDRMASQ